MSLSVLVLERPGRWRLAGLLLVFTASLLPAVPLFSAWGDSVHLLSPEKLGKFSILLFKSLATSLLGGIFGLLLGLSTGIFYAFYDYPWKKPFLFSFLLTIMVPTLLWSISLNNLSVLSPFPVYLFHGYPALILVTVMVTFPLVTASTISACSGLNPSQCDAVRMAAGEGRLLKLAVRYVLPAAIVAACLGSLLIISSPGPAMGLGVKTAVTEILVSFSALYDMKLAAVQCLLMSGATLIFTVSVLAFSGKRPMELLVSSAKGLAAKRHEKMSRLAFYFNLVCCLVFVAMPVTGLVLP
ncbi:MAG: hypothetical protein DSZ23_04595, partial [Thermodesulfatator sp.]